MNKWVIFVFTLGFLAIGWASGKKSQPTVVPQTMMTTMDAFVATDILAGLHPKKLIPANEGFKLVQNETLGTHPTTQHGQQSLNGQQDLPAASAPLLQAPEPQLSPSKKPAVVLPVPQDKAVIVPAVTPKTTISQPKPSSTVPSITPKVTPKTGKPPVTSKPQLTPKVSKPQEIQPIIKNPLIPKVPDTPISPKQEKPIPSKPIPSQPKPATTPKSKPAPPTLPQKKPVPTPKTKSTKPHKASHHRPPEPGGSSSIENFVPATEPESFRTVPTPVEISVPNGQKDK